MRVLHVASFIGNIGDNASHKGFYSLLDKYYVQYSVERLEIRRFYQNYKQSGKLSFDEEFIDFANKFDLLVIGGGGFLDYWLPNSNSGTTIDMTPSIVSKIKVRTLITSVGCMPHKVIPEGNIDKFRLFLDAILENKNISLAVRNDGSKENLKIEIGKKYYDAIPEVLDSGFFYQNSNLPALPINKPYVALNITDDQIHMLSKVREQLDVTQYYAELEKIVRFIVYEENMHLVFVPHIHSDLNAILHLINNFSDYDIRQYFSIAPCIQGFNGADYLFSIYKHSDLVIASRLHANICSLAMNKKVIGLGVLDRVSYIYSHIGLSNQCELISGRFSNGVVEKLSSSLHGKEDKGEILEQRKVQTLKIYNTLM